MPNSIRSALLALVISALVPAIAIAEIREQSIRFATGRRRWIADRTRHAEVCRNRRREAWRQDRGAALPGGMLGGDMQVVTSLQGGLVQMSTMNAGLMASLAPDFALLDLPFLFDSPAQADAVMDGPLGDALAAQLGDKGLEALAYWELGFRNLTNSRRPVVSVDDIKGLKIRVVQSPIYLELLSALGANPVPMPFPEVYTALETAPSTGRRTPQLRSWCCLGSGGNSLAA